MFIRLCWHAGRELDGPGTTDHKKLMRCDNTHLSGFAAAGVAAHDSHVVLSQRLQQGLPNLAHWQLLPLAAPLHALRAVPPCLQAPQHVPALCRLQVQASSSLKPSSPPEDILAHPART